MCITTFADTLSVKLHLSQKRSFTSHGMSLMAVESIQKCLLEN